MDKQFCVYLMTNKINGTLYVGVTSNLPKRVWEHKEGIGSKFTKKHNCKLLVWYEMHDNAESAITKEKQIKDWKREWKINRIREFNPEWNDLYESICQ